MVEFSPFFFQTEKLSHADLDERALDALKEFPVEVGSRASLTVIFLRHKLEKRLIGLEVGNQRPMEVMEVVWTSKSQIRVHIS